MAEEREREPSSLVKGSRILKDNAFVGYDYGKHFNFAHNVNLTSKMPNDHCFLRTDAIDEMFRVVVENDAGIFGAKLRFPGGAIEHRGRLFNRYRKRIGYRPIGHDR